MFRVGVWSLFGFFILLGGCSTLTAHSTQDVPVIERPHILWKVASPKNTIYLAGSIHVMQKEDYPLDQAFDRAFQQSSQVMFEVDLDEISSPLAQMNMVRKGLYLNGESLPMVLPPESYATAKAELSDLGQQIEDFHRMKPWMVATAVMALELQKLGFESAYGVDRYFFEKAKAAGKDIQGLETVEFQLNLFDQLSPSTQEQFLLQTLEELKNLNTQVHDILKAWKQGHVQQLEALLAGMGDYPELNQALVLNRNQAWLPHMEQALQEKEPVLIVVGALHLLGKDGLVEALKERGYRVQQL
ncbi:MAG: TraB/GumN family protein [Nitrospirota bacterium]|nr:TraB/GumN family protein [Nitrospirota bacterium]